MLRGQPDGAVVFAAVADALEDEALPVGAGENGPRFVVEGGSEPRRVGEDDVAADRGDEVEEGVAEDVLGEHLAGQVLVEEGGPVGQRQVGGPEDDAVGVEAERVPVAEGDAAGSEAAVVG